MSNSANVKLFNCSLFHQSFFLDAWECSEYEFENNYVPLLFKSILTFLAEQFVIALKNGQKQTK